MRISEVILEAMVELPQPAKPGILSDFSGDDGIVRSFMDSAEQGIGVSEMPPSKVRADIEQIEKIVNWLDAWPERRRDSTSTTAVNKRPSVARTLLSRVQLGSA